MSGQTIISYEDTALPVQNVAVTLFDSSESFPPGGSLHLLGQQWFQYSLGIASGTGVAAGDVTGSYSNDKGVTWVPFYTSATTAGNDPAVAVNADEVYIGMYKDVRFEFMVDAATENTTVFEANLALHCSKPTSKVSTADVLHDNGAAAGELDTDAA